MSAFRLNDWVLEIECARLSIDEAADKRARERILASLSAPDDDRSELVNERSKVKSWLWRRNLSSKELLEIARVR